MKNHKLVNALQIVKAEAEKKERYYNHLRHEKPYIGTSPEDHVEWCAYEAAQASWVARWCFFRIMQLDPD